MNTRIAQTVQNGLRHAHLLCQAIQVCGCFFIGDEHRHLRSAKCYRTHPQVDAHAGRVPQSQRHHIGGDAVDVFSQPGGAPQRLNTLLAAALAMQQHHRVQTTGLHVSRKHGFKTHALLTGTRVRVGQRARGAHSGASSAADTQVGIHNDLLAAFVAANSAGRANVHASIAANGFVAAVSAKFLFVGKKFRFFKFTHHVTQLDHRRHQARGRQTI